MVGANPPPSYSPGLKHRDVSRPGPGNRLVSGRARSQSWPVCLLVLLCGPRGHEGQLLTCHHFDWLRPGTAWTLVMLSPKSPETLQDGATKSQVLCHRQSFGHAVLMGEYQFGPALHYAGFYCWHRLSPFLPCPAGSSGVEFECCSTQKVRFRQALLFLPMK